MSFLNDVPCSRPHTRRMVNTSLAGIKALVIEEEFLIALDIGLVIEEAGGKSRSLRSFQDALNAKEQWTEYQLAIVNPPDGSISEAEIARDMQEAGIRLVICTADSGTSIAKLGLGIAPIVVKPFTAEDLLAACAVALELS